MKSRWFRYDRSRQCESNSTLFQVNSEDRVYSRPESEVTRGRDRIGGGLRVGIRVSGDGLGGPSAARVRVFGVWTSPVEGEEVWVSSGEKRRRVGYGVNTAMCWQMSGITREHSTAYNNHRRAT